MAVTSVSAASNYYTQAAAAGPVSIATALAALKANPRTKVNISDTSENLARNLDTLGKLSNNITQVTQSDPSAVLNVSATQLSKLGGLWSKFSTDYQLAVSDVAAANAGAVSGNAHVQSFKISDTGARLSTQLDSLLGKTKLTSIALTDPAVLLKVTATQLADDAEVVAKLSGNYGLAVSGASAIQAVSYADNFHVKSVAVLDTAAHISGKLDDLRTLGLRLKEVRGSDVSRFEVNADQLQTDALVIGKMYKGYQLSVLGASMDQTPAILNNKKVVSVDIVDTAANLSKHLDLLQRLGTSLHSVHVTDTDNALTMSSAQFGTYAQVLSKIKSDDLYSVAVTGASVSDAQALADNTHISAISVSDSSSAISMALDDLQQNTKVTRIGLTGKLTALSVSYSQLSSDSDALGKIQGNYNLNVRGVTAENALSLAVGNSRVSSLSVSDTGAHLLGKLNELAALGKRLSSIVQSDSNTALSLSVSQWSSNMGLLSKINGGYSVALSGVSAAKAQSMASDSRVASLTVSDSAAAISSQLDSLHGLGAQLTAITQTDADSALSVTANQWATQSATFAKLGDYALAVRNASAAQVTQIAADTHVGAVAVTDSAANIAAQLDNIQSAITTHSDLQISLSQVGTGTMGITASQLVSDADALAAMTNNYSLSVSGVAAEDASDVAQNPKVFSMTVASNALNLAANLSDLAALGAKVSSINQLDPGTALQLTASEWNAYGGVLNKVNGGVRAALSEVSAASAQAALGDVRVVSVAVLDSGSQISANLDKLQGLGPALTAIDQSDTSVIPVRMGQIASAAAALGKLGADAQLAVKGASSAQAQVLLSNEQVVSVDVSDSSSNIAASLDDLQANDKLASITQTGAASPLALTQAQLTDDADALGKINGSYSVSVSDASATDVATLAANGHVSGMVVTDTGSAMVDALGDLKAAGNKISSIVLSNPTVDLAMTAAQWTSNQATLGKISTAYSAALSAVNASSASSLAADARVSRLAVSDSTAHIQANLAALQALGPKLSEIAPTEATAPTMTLTAAQFANSASALGKIKDGNYALAVTAATAADVSSLAADSKVVSIAVADSSDNIASRLAVLNATGKVSQLTQTGTASTMTLDADLFAASSTTLGKIQGGYSVSVQGADVATASSLQANSHVLAFTVTDTTAAVGAALTSLSAKDKLGDIYLSEDNGPITLTQTQVDTLSDTIGQLQGGYRLNVTDVSVGNLEALSLMPHVNTLGVKASSQEVSANFDDLVALGATVSGITLTTLSTPIALTVDQWQKGSSTLGKVQGDYHLALLDANAQDATGLSTQAHVDTVSVGDTAANISAQFDDLLALGSQLDALELTDDASLVLTQAQASAGAALLAKVVGSFDVTISDA